MWWYFINYLQPNILVLQCKQLYHCWWILQCGWLQKQAKTLPRLKSPQSTCDKKTPRRIHNCKKSECHNKNSNCSQKCSQNIHKLLTKWHQNIHNCMRSESQNKYQSNDMMIIIRIHIWFSSLWALVTFCNLSGTKTEFPRGWFTTRACSLFVHLIFWSFYIEKRFRNKYR